MDEYSLDREALAELQAANRAPAGARVTALAQVVQRQPGSTAAAIALLHALRTEGMLDTAQAGATSEPSAIPRRIVQYWAGGEPPPAIRALAAAWRDANPGFACELLTDSEALPFLRDAIGAVEFRRLHRVTLQAQATDLFRLVTLHRLGGVFADPAARPVGTVAALLPGGARLVLVQSVLGHVESGLLAAAPGHPVLARAIEALIEALLRGDMDTRWLATGPGLLTRALAAEIVADPAGVPGGLRGLALIEAPRVLREVACPRDLPRGAANLSGGLLTY